MCRSEPDVAVGLQRRPVPRQCRVGSGTAVLFDDGQLNMHGQPARIRLPSDGLAAGEVLHVRAPAGEDQPWCPESAHSTR